MLGEFVLDTWTELRILLSSLTKEKVWIVFFQVCICNSDLHFNYVLFTICLCIWLHRWYTTRWFSNTYHTHIQAWSNCGLLCPCSVWSDLFNCLLCLQPHFQREEVQFIVNLKAKYVYVAKNAIKFLYIGVVDNCAIFLLYDFQSDSAYYTKTKLSDSWWSWVDVSLCLCWSPAYNRQKCISCSMCSEFIKANHVCVCHVLFCRSMLGCLV